MRYAQRIPRAAALLCALLLGLALTVPAHAARSGDNRCNIVIVLDASGSMKYTDPSGYRYAALNQFVHLLSERGDVLGGIAFSAGIDSASAPVRMEGRAAKEALADTLRRVPATGQYTNIGLALVEAVRLLREHGDPALPSVILLLSDGSTDMDSAANQEKSLSQKADAIQAARESGIPVYCVCLNVENSRYHAIVSEMEQVSRGTGGVSVEVGRAEDLREVFNTLYDLIYGASTTTLVDEVFPDTGRIETRFDVPQVGVEEVNIIINGHTSRISLLDPSGGTAVLPGSADPSGSTSDPSGGTVSRYDAEGFTMLKLSRPAPGIWYLVTEGVPGDQIKVNMVYNSSLSVELSLDSDESNIDVARHVTFTASLRDGSVPVTAAEPAPVSPAPSSQDPASQNPPSQDPASPDPAAPDPASPDPAAQGGGTSGGNLVLYPASPLAGYTAVLNVMNARREVLRREPMASDGGVFTFTSSFPEGTYYFSATVTGQYVTRDSEEIGPFTFGDFVVNTAPVPTGVKVTENINVYPFGLGGSPSYSLDLSTLATDPEGGELRYEIVSTPFIEGTDYHVEDNVLTLDHFSIRKGGFTVRATDEYGLSCDVEVLVRTHDVGLMALLGMVLAALGGLILLYVLYDRLFPPFRGEITVSGLIGEEATPAVSRNPRRGKCPLSVFDAPDIGLDPDRTFFKAATGREIRFVPSRPVTYNGLDSVEVRVPSGAEASVCVGGNYERRLLIRFDSRVPARRRGGRYSGDEYKGHARPGGGERSDTYEGHARPTGER